MTASKGKLDAVYPALLAIINNVAAYTENLSPSASSRLLQLFASMSSPSFLLANETNHTLLQSLMESINAMIEHQFSSKSTSINMGMQRLTVFREPQRRFRCPQVAQALRSPPLLHPRERTSRNRASGPTCKGSQQRRRSSSRYHTIPPKFCRQLPQSGQRTNSLPQQRARRELRFRHWRRRFGRGR